MDRFKDQLRRQIKFLRNSCQAFDKGDWEEAIRIATSIRVLVHDTQGSTSILKHLNAKNINLFSTRTDMPAWSGGAKYTDGFSMGVISIGQGRGAYGPDLSDFSPDSSLVLPVDKWWEQIVWILSSECKLTRKRLILSAANQDGGAHVDRQLHEDYEKLANEQFGHITTKNGSQHYRQDVVNMHLVSIRTIANELLKSPELLNLLE